MDGYMVGVANCAICSHPDEQKCTIVSMNNLATLLFTDLSISLDLLRNLGEGLLAPGGGAIWAIDLSAVVFKLPL